MMVWLVVVDGIGDDDDESEGGQFGFKQNLCEFRRLLMTACSSSCAVFGAFPISAEASSVNDLSTRVSVGNQRKKFTLNGGNACRVVSTNFFRLGSVYVEKSYGLYGDLSRVV